MAIINEPITYITRLCKHAGTKSYRNLWGNLQMGSYEQKLDVIQSIIAILLTLSEFENMLNRLVLDTKGRTRLGHNKGRTYL